MNESEHLHVRQVIESILMVATDPVPPNLLAQLLEKQSRRPAFINTWVDAIFCVFDEVEDGLALALDSLDGFLTFISYS